ncbi:hypothetical protein [Methylobacterium brachiatum]|uniref:hypothetical protein n=1 Tax=Methylobacterium brachiatum TaxID=269660 RepID=UPI000EFB39D7|nr:hypothetical protein [Methylobacterium brachiatum]AYO83664.1 hypothetical protein EBB05_16245 [Methylobacterium brachiatum]
MTKAVLLKPLDGSPAGTVRDFDKADFETLRAMGAVRAASDVGEKAAPPVLNKAAPPVANKDITRRPAGRVGGAD